MKNTSRKAAYSKFFRPPIFLEMRSVAIEPTENSLNYLCMKTTDKGLITDQYGSLPIEEGSFKAGEIVKRDNLLKAISDIKKKTQKDFVRVAIPEEQTYIFKTTIPRVEPKEIRGLVEFKLEENVPFSAKEAVFDYDLIQDNIKGDHLDLIVSVAPLKYIQDLENVFESVGLTPVLFTPESTCVAKAVVKEGNEQTIVIINIKETNIVMSFVVNGLVWQTSTMNFGANAFTESLKKHYNVSFEEALKMKKEKLYQETAETMDIFSALINTVSAIKDEAFRFISYCDERDDVRDSVDKVIICGEDATIIGLSKYLELNLKLDVEVADVWTNCFSSDDYLPEMHRRDSLGLSCLVGLNLFEI